MLLYLPDYYLIGMGIWLLFLGCSLPWMLGRRRAWRTQPRRLKWIHAGLSVWFLLVILTFPELWFALLYDKTDSFNFTNVSTRWFQRHVQLNDQGFRDRRQLTVNPPEGRERIAFLGDSFTFGHGIESIHNRLSDRVDRDLERIAPGRYAAINMGVSGIGVNDMAPIWQRKIIDPGCPIKIAVYCICLNDIEWMARSETEKEYEPLGKAKPQFFLFRDTYFYNWLYYRIRFLLQPKLISYYDYVQKYYEGPPWKKMRAEIDDLRNLMQRNGTELRIVIFPFMHNLGPDYPFRSAHQHIVDYAHERGIRVLDLEPVLTPHAREGLTVNPFDAHPNARANELAADAIERDLLSDLVQPLEQKTRKL